MQHEIHQMILDRENREFDLKMVRHRADAERLRQQLIREHSEDYVFRLECSIYDEWLAELIPSILKHGLNPCDYGTDPQTRRSQQ